MCAETKFRLAAAAALLSTAVAGCGAEPSTAEPVMPPNTAIASINDSGATERYFVSCDQIQWLLTIDAVDETAGFTAMIGTGDAPDPKFVKIRNLGGFTGSAWKGGVGQLDAHRDGAVITLAGTGYGFFADAPGQPTTARFTITTAC